MEDLGADYGLLRAAVASLRGRAGRRQEMLCSDSDWGERPRGGGAPTTSWDDIHFLLAAGGVIKEASGRIRDDPTLYYHLYLPVTTSSAAIELN